jgi:hypothetical protein
MGHHLGQQTSSSSEAVLPVLRAAADSTNKSTDNSSSSVNAASAQGVLITDPVKGAARSKE